MPQHDNSKVSIIIPAFNEEKIIGDIVRRVKSINSNFEVIVVSDGSKDRTADVAREAGAKVIRHPYNVGNGASIKDGVHVCTGDIIVFIDGDGQHPPEDIPRLLEPIGDYDMVVGARTRYSETSVIRNIGNKMLIFIAQWMVGRKIDDLTSGFRAVKREKLLCYLHLFPNRYSYPTTLTMAMISEGDFINFVPLDLIKKRKEGKSHIRPIRDFISFVAIMLRVILLFNPRKFFVPIGGILFLVGVSVGTLQLIYTGGVQSTGVTLVLASIYTAFFGLLADQIALLRRQSKYSAKE